MPQPETYPDFFFYVFGILGLIFLVKKPQYNFFMAIFYFSAREVQRSVFTRIPLFGPYLNLDDFIILLMLVSLVHYSFSRKIKIPSAVWWIALCIFSSILIIGVKYSFTYAVQREHKFALYFLVGIFLGYNYIIKENELKTILKIIFFGSIVVSIQYVLFTQLKLEEYGPNVYYETIRSVGFLALIPSIIVASFFIKLKWLENTKIKLIYFLGLSLMIVNLALSQTRSIYIAIILTVLVIFFTRKEIKTKTLLLTSIVIPFLVFIIFDQYLKLLNINQLIFGRLELLSDSPTTDITTIGRLSAIDYEFKAFLSSSIIFGNGIGFNYFLPEASNPYISWGHIGPIAYLSRMGVLGFIVYSIFIPFTAYSTLKKLKVHTLKYNYIKIFVLFSSALVISDWISFWMSASYLTIGAFLPGIIIGIVWSIKDKRIILSKYSNEKAKIEIPENQYSYTVIQPGSIPGTNNSVSN